MLQILKTWFIATLVFVGLDMVWLGKIMSNRYTKQLGYLGKLSNGKIQFNLPVGLLVQIIIASGLVFVLMKSLTHKNTIYDSVYIGAVVGFVIYATYDLTNLSFIKNWPLDLTIIDILWGTFQGVVAGVVVWYMQFRG